MFDEFAFVGILNWANLPVEGVNRKSVVMLAAANQMLPSESAVIAIGTEPAVGREHCETQRGVAPVVSLMAPLFRARTPPSVATARTRTAARTKPHVRRT